MITSPIHARQPLRQPWTCEQLLQEQAITPGQAIDTSTWKNYGSALNSYLNFIKLHQFPLEPTPDTLSLFITIYMCHHIKPASVTTYLSRICQQLEPYFPQVHSAHNSALVHCTLQGCRHLSASPTSCKCALTLADLKTIVNALTDSLVSHRQTMIQVNFVDLYGSRVYVVCFISRPSNRVRKLLCNL